MGLKPKRRRSPALEQLDHRRLLTVNFTGNVATDFPATEQPGVVVFNSSNTPNIQHPIIPPNLQPYINVSGFDISEIRVSYDSADDTLYVGFNQPASGNPGQPGSVIAGDADDNGSAGSVNPQVETAAPGFTEFPALGGPEEMAAYLDFTGTGVPQVVAGFSPNAPAPTPTNPDPAKPYEVALAIPNPSNPTGIPSFGTPLPSNTGSVYLFNSAAHPNLEFAITDFSKLYQEETGKALTSGSVISIGGFAGSPDDIGISDAFFPANSFTLAAATQPPTCPPQSPSILVNPHEHRIVDTAHRDLIRATILGTSNFQVADINPSTVTLDGVHSVAHITRKIRRDQFPMATYVFVANQLNLPPGLSNVTLQGTLNNGVTQFVSSTAVLNIPYSARIKGTLHGYLGGGTIYKHLAKLEARNPSIAIDSSNSTGPFASENPEARGTAAIKVNYSPIVGSPAVAAKAAATRLSVDYTPAIRSAR